MTPSPTGPAFFDSNILIYADDASSRSKQRKAIRLLTEYQRRGEAVYSVQVLQEYFVVATRKLGVDAALAQQKVEVLAGERVVRLDAQDVIAAIELHRLRVISFWDALIVHAARLANCAVIYSEDMIGGGQIGNVRVVNPFA